MFWHINDSRDIRDGRMITGFCLCKKVKRLLPVSVLPSLAVLWLGREDLEERDTKDGRMLLEIACARKVKRLLPVSVLPSLAVLLAEARRLGRTRIWQMMKVEMVGTSLFGIMN